MRLSTLWNVSLRISGIVGDEEVRKASMKNCKEGAEMNYAVAGYNCSAYFVEMLATPLGSVFPRVTVKHSKESLSPDTGEIDDERVRVFHVPARSLVLGHANLKGSVSNRVLVEDL